MSIPLPAKIERKKTGCKKISTEYTCQLFSLLKRWCPQRRIVMVADGGFAVHEIYRRAVSRHVTMITRCRQDIAIYEPLVKPVERPAHRPRTHGPRLPALRDIGADPDTVWTKRDQEEISFQDGHWHRGRTKASPVPVRCVLIREIKPDSSRGPVMTISCTDQSLSPEKIVDLYKERWSTEVTFQETRAHLGVETGRGWADNTIARTTPLLMALFSLVVLMANSLGQSNPLAIRQASWYQKESPTFIDLLAAVRRELWSQSIYDTGHKKPLVKQLTTNLARSMLDTLCYAA